MTTLVWIVFDGKGRPAGYADHRDAAEAYARDLDFQQRGPAKVTEEPRVLAREFLEHTNWDRVTS